MLNLSRKYKSFQLNRTAKLLITALNSVPESLLRDLQTIQGVKKSKRNDEIRYTAPDGSYAVVTEGRHAIAKFFIPLKVVISMSFGFHDVLDKLSHAKLADAYSDPNLRNEKLFELKSAVHNLEKTLISFKQSTIPDVANLLKLLKSTIESVQKSSAQDFYDVFNQAIYRFNHGVLRIKDFLLKKAKWLDKVFESHNPYQYFVNYTASN